MTQIKDRPIRVATWWLWFNYIFCMIGFWASKIFVYIFAACGIIILLLSACGIISLLSSYFFGMQSVVWSILAFLFAGYARFIVFLYEKTALYKLMQKRNIIESDRDLLAYCGLRAVDENPIKRKASWWLWIFATICVLTALAAIWNICFHFIHLKGIGSPYTTSEKYLHYYYENQQVVYKVEYIKKHGSIYTIVKNLFYLPFSTFWNPNLLIMWYRNRTSDAELLKNCGLQGLDR